MPRCIDSLKTNTTFYHPKYMVRFKSTNTACSTPVFINNKQLFIAASEKLVDDKETLQYFNPKVFLAGVYKIFNLDDLSQWILNNKLSEEDTITRIMDLAWDSITDDLDDMIQVYKTLYPDTPEHDLYKIVSKVWKENQGEQLSYYSRKSYHKLIKKSIEQK